MNFIQDIESAMEFIEYLPQYEFPEAEPVTRPDFNYKD